MQGEVHSAHLGESGCRLQLGLTGSQMEVVGKTLTDGSGSRGELDGREVGDLGHVCRRGMVLKCLEEAFGRLWGLDQSRNLEGHMFRGLGRRQWLWACSEVSAMQLGPRRAWGSEGVKRLGPELFGG